MNNDEKVKTILESEPVPQELEPENIKKNGIQQKK